MTAQEKKKILKLAEKAEDLFLQHKKKIFLYFFKKIIDKLSFFVL